MFNNIDGCCMDECWYWNCSIPKCMIHDASCKKMLGTVFHDNKFEALLPHSISPHCLPCPRYCTRQYGGVCTPQGSPIPSDENERSLWVIFWAFCCFFLCKQVARTYVRLGRILSFSVVALLHAACSWIIPLPLLQHGPMFRCLSCSGENDTVLKTY